METPGRRVPVVNLGREPAPMIGEFPALERAGDYCGPLRGWTGDAPAVFFLLPVARDAGACEDARRVHHVTLPPHQAVEEPDGSLTIRGSIQSPHWHGFLERGVWREC